jgi:hypothetical protein
MALFWYLVILLATWGAFRLRRWYGLVDDRIDYALGFYICACGLMAAWRTLVG